MNEQNVVRTALKIDNPVERDAYLDSVCGRDSLLRERLNALIRTHGEAGALSSSRAPEANQSTGLMPEHGAELEAESIIDDEVLAFLEPSTEPRSLGRLDHFEILKVVGKGGMGVVFKARDTRLQCIVAIKVLAAHLAASGAARQRFFREARAFAAVRDEHVVSIHAVSDDNRPVPYLVMEYIAGVSLEKRVKKHGPLAVKEILRIGMQAAAGLAAAHKQGLIHRDIKPANILLENSVERVKITDFGLARAADDVSLSQSGMLAGTPPYMSPEQARSEPLDRRSDLFSLGSVLYALCTGELAFWAESVVGALKRVCEDTPRPIRELNPDIPEWLEEIVNKLLSKDPAERLQSADELKGILRRRLAELQDPHLLPGPATSETWLPPAVVAPAPAPPTVSLSRTKGSSRWRRVAAGVMLLVVLVSALAAGVAIVGDRWRQPSPSGSAAASGIPAPPPRPDDPRVLTVSRRPADKARFNTIGAALDAAEEGMTVRVIDDAVYEEFLWITTRHAGVTLEAAGHATVRGLPDKTDVVDMRNVPRFTLRGLHFIGKKHVIHIEGHCPGTVLDRLDVTGNGHGDCINLYGKAAGTKDAPIVIQNCVLREGMHAVQIEASVRDDWDRPWPCGHVVIRNNTVTRCRDGITCRGAVHQILIAGNCILETEYGAVELSDPLRGTADVFIVNNTLFRNRKRGVGIWDDHEKGKVFLECKNIRCQNNLVLEHDHAFDQFLFDHRRNDYEQPKPGDVKSLLLSPEWHFSHNWHEMVPPDRDSPLVALRIPPGVQDHVQVPIEVLSRKPSNPNFLRPAKDSPLAIGGIGAKGSASDLPLPAYVGAVPPEGVEPWDWDKTWRALAH